MFLRYVALQFGFLTFLGFLLPPNVVKGFDDAVNDFVSHGSLLDGVGTSRSTFFGFLPNLDPNPDLDAISDPSLSYAVVKNKNPLATLFTLPSYKSCKTCHTS